MTSFENPPLLMIECVPLRPSLLDTLDMIYFFSSEFTGKDALTHGKKCQDGLVRLHKLDKHYEQSMIIDNTMTSLERSRCNNHIPFFTQPTIPLSAALSHYCTSPNTEIKFLYLDSP